MTDYKEEQANELEAIESIYPEELEVIRRDPPAVFTIAMVSQKLDQYEEEDEIHCTLQFTYTAKYPDEALLVEIAESDDLDEEQENDLMNVVHEQIEENLGMAMVFTIVSAVQERLTCMVEETQKKKADAIERQKKAEEELEQKKFEGTRCTIENFLAWKATFDAEMEELAKKKQETEPNKHRLTGYELFMRDASMMDSDINFEPPEGEAVEVDESLFQDLEDVDLADEGLDEELSD